MPLSDQTLDHLRRVASLPDLGGTKYRILEILGRGGMGTVYLAKDTALRRHVALKVLHIADPSGAAAARMGREARILAQLEHPGIVPVHDVGVLPDGRVFYVMKLVRGERLDQYRASHPSQADLLRLFHKLCETVAFAHSHGVIHRDLKPQNIMVGSFGEVLVMDWGVAKLFAPGAAYSHTSRSDNSAVCGAADAADEGTPAIGNAQAPVLPVSSASDLSAALHPSRPPALPEPFPDTPASAAWTEAGAILGTRDYMPPEQARGETSRTSTRADVYSLGAILYFLVSGSSPPPSTFSPAPPGPSSPASVALSKGARVPEDVSTGKSSPSPIAPRPPLARRLAAICSKAMSVDPAARYPSASALAADISCFLDHEPVSAYQEDIFERAARFVSRNRTPFLLILAYLVMRALLLFFTHR